MSPHDLRSLSVADLLALYAKLMDELRDAGVVRSTNNPVSDYTELLVCAALGLTRLGNSSAGSDAVDARGHRYQIKGRRLSKANSSTELSAIRRLDHSPFDSLIGVIYRPDFTIDYAAKIPLSVVRERATFKPHTNAHCFHLKRSVLAEPLVVEVTSSLVRCTIERPIDRR